MAECECLKKCPFFNDEMKEYPKSAEILKERYCKSGFNECARYMVLSANKGQVPKDLYPYERSKAKEIIRNYENE